MRLLIPFSLVAAIAGSPTLSRAADFDGPYYRERDVVVEHPAPVVVERERIIERRYYPPQEEVYAAPTYYAPRYYAPYAYNYPYAYGYPGYRAAYFARPYWRHRHYYHGW
jgi:hypothetical protein